MALVDHVDAKERETRLAMAIFSLPHVPWTPETHRRFGVPEFRRIVRAFYTCRSIFAQTTSRPSSRLSLSDIPNELVVTVIQTLCRILFESPEPASI